MKIVLKSGMTIPSIGLGTDGIAQNNVTATIETAIQIGYELIDTATGYENHKQITLALKKANRDKIFVCTKFHEGDIATHKTAKNIVDHMLSELGVDYIDLLLIHNPSVPNFSAVFKDMILLKKSGKLKSLGVSNFAIKHLLTMENAFEHLDVNQVEFHPLLNQIELYKFCKRHHIHIMAYRPFAFGSQDLLNNLTITKIANDHKKSNAQIILKWLTQYGFTAIPRARNERHLKDNLAIVDFELSIEEIEAVNDLNQNLRTCTGFWADFDDKT